ncbi:hypothetical protein Klosneuvirus_2_37 [Klosneuvirus KNV1]|uniref:Uncharacterized protein n=1 Tax=Klosneuvirus KNV1 TaxID=1977640 RepID=A0A1V0SIW6_9VIRU|nr:hypothetical protein Klosneuvirus_2_37 [Klosneuvirus KNV1]
MSYSSYLITCLTEETRILSAYVPIEPTTCPNDITHIIAPDQTTVYDTQYRTLVADGYIDIDSALSDNQALQLRASNVNGGILMDAGFGGIAVNTTNAIGLNAAAASNFTTSNGNLSLQATAGLVNIDSGSGVNICNGSSSTPIMIGTSAYSKDITIGNNTGTSSTTIKSGTGKISMNSAATGSDAITAFSSGGIDLEATGLARVASADNTVSAITLDASANGGGVVLSSGAQGVILTSNGGPIALGSWSGGDIYVGTAAVARTVTVGNATGSTTLNLSSGTGGTTSTTTGLVNISSSSSSGSAITLDASSNNGGIVLASGTQGIYLSSNGGPIALGSFTGGDVYIGTASVARTIYIGNTTSTTALNLNAGTGGITIGNDANNGEIQIGKASNAKVITIGNSTGASRLFNRFGTGGFIKHQEADVSLSDADATLTITDILKSIFTITPTVDRTLTLPTAALAVAGISGVEIGDAIDFIIINNSTPANEAFIMIANGTGSSITGNTTIAPASNNVSTFYTSGSGTFRIRFTNVTGGSEAYVAYRIA